MCVWGVCRVVFPALWGEGVSKRDLQEDRDDSFKVKFHPGHAGVAMATTANPVHPLTLKLWGWLIQIQRAHGGGDGRTHHINLSRREIPNPCSGCSLPRGSFQPWWGKLKSRGYLRLQRANTRTPVGEELTRTAVLFRSFHAGVFF